MSPVIFVLVALLNLSSANPAHEMRRRDTWVDLLDGLVRVHVPTRNELRVKALSLRQNLTLVQVEGNGQNATTAATKSAVAENKNKKKGKSSGKKTAGVDAKKPSVGVHIDSLVDVEI